MVSKNCANPAAGLVDSYDRIIAEWYNNGGRIMEDAVNRDYNK